MWFWIGCVVGWIAARIKWIASANVFLLLMTLLCCVCAVCY